MKHSLPLTLVLIIVVFSVYFISTHLKGFQPPQTQPPKTLGVETQAPIPTSQNLLSRTKTSGCVINGPLPDKECSPGAIFQAVTKEQVCTPGYSKAVRDVPVSEKNQVYAEYGITSHKPGEYEIDHIISLELGGSNDIANLYPEAAEPRPGFHEKDKVENYLHDQICKGAITLQEAQQQIANNWIEVYKQISSR